MRDKVRDAARGTYVLVVSVMLAKSISRIYQTKGMRQFFFKKLYIHLLDSPRV